MKLSKLSVLIAVGILAGCSVQSPTQRAEETVGVQKLMELERQIEQGYNEDYWSLYNDAGLDKLVQNVLEENIDLKNATLSLKKLNYAVSAAENDRFPTLSGNFKSSASQNLDTATSSVGHSVGVNASYTLDLFGKLKSNTNLAEWQYLATAYDREALMLSLKSTVIKSYHQLSYLNEVIKLNKESIRNYEQLLKITQDKFKAGVGYQNAVEQARSQLLSAKQNLNSSIQQKRALIVSLNNLFLNEEKLDYKVKDFNKIKVLKPNLEIPLAVVSLLPNIKEKEATLVSKIHSVDIATKSLYPDITIGASLSGSSDKLDHVFAVPFLGGNVGISLPFLNYQKLKWNIKSKKADFEIAGNNLHKELVQTLNGVKLNKTAYETAKENYELQLRKYEEEKKIAAFYKGRYEAGIVEFKDYLQSVNSELQARLNVATQKHTLIQAVDNLYASINVY